MLLAQSELCPKTRHWLSLSVFKDAGVSLLVGAGTGVQGAADP